jgi:hypothetical protein
MVNGDVATRKLAGRPITECVLDGDITKIKIESRKKETVLIQEYVLDRSRKTA